MLYLLFFIMSNKNENISLDASLNGQEDEVKSSLGGDFEARTEAKTEEIQGQPKNNVEEQLNDQIAELKEQLAEAKSQVLLAFADKENSIKRLENDKKEAISYANQSLIRLLVEPLEQLFLALQQKPEENASENYKNMYLGVEMTKNELLKVLANNGLKRIYPEGQKFDPNLHQAISMVEDQSVESQTIKAVVQAGYELHNRLIKPALCVVVK